MSDQVEVAPLKILSPQLLRWSEPISGEATSKRAEARTLLGGLELWGMLTRLDASAVDDRGGHPPAS